MIRCITLPTCPSALHNFFRTKVALERGRPRRDAWHAPQHQGLGQLQRCARQLSCPEDVLAAPAVESIKPCPKHKRLMRI